MRFRRTPATPIAIRLVPACVAALLFTSLLPATEPQTGSWGDIKYKSAMPSEDDAVVVQVLGRQFEWHFRYSGPDKEFGTTDDVVSPFHLYIPVDKDVIVKLQTLDVLHSFWLPNVRLKQDLVPGMTIPQWFKCVKTGDYEIVCAELCGSGHTKMKGNLHVLTAAEFDAWLATAAGDVFLDGIPRDDLHLHAPLDDGPAEETAVCVDGQSRRAPLSETAEWQDGHTGPEAVT